MLLKTSSRITKPPPYARVDLTHPLGRKCQAVILFSSGQGLGKNAGPVGATTFIETPPVQYYQTQNNRLSMIFGTTVPVMTANSYGPAMFFGSDFSGMDIGVIPGFETYDLDYPEFGVGATVDRGQTICVIRRKVDTTLRASTLFGVEDAIYGTSVNCCGTHCPFSDGFVYWDYGNNTGLPNRIIATGQSWHTRVERFVFHAGPRGSAIWRDGQVIASQAVAVSRIVPAMASDFSGWTLNGGNRRAVNGSGDIQEINFIIYIADQWSDAQIQWWFEEPYAMLYTSFMDRSYFFLGAAAAPPAISEHASSWMM